MKNLLKYALSALATFVLQSFASAWAQDVPVGASNGLQVSQENFTFSGASQAFSDYGLAAVDLAKMTSTTGISQGFLNVYDPSLPSSSAWIIQNLPIDSASGLPGISTFFNLGNTPGTPVSQVTLQADLSVDPKSSFTGLGNNANYVTTQLDYNAEGGKGADRTAPPGVAPNPGLVSFNGAGTSLTWQTGHTSVEQDKNQCGPAAVANSLDWLRTTYGAKTPLNPALKNTPGTAPGGVPTPADSLVAQLDKAAGRAPGQTVTDPQLLIGPDGKSGKLGFINDPSNGLAGKLRIEHWPSDTLHGNQTVGTTTSIDASLAIKGKEIDWIISEVQKGEDVEVSWLWSGGGGHWVDIVGAGRILGVPWFAYVQDANQGNLGGTNWYDGGIGFTTVSDANLLPTTIAGASGAATLDSAISESVPEPGTITLLATGMLCVLGLGRRKKVS